MIDILRFNINLSVHLQLRRMMPHAQWRWQCWHVHVNVVTVLDVTAASRLSASAAVNSKLA